jgi:YebC/PmpR family DNA-binding regulatory protein
MAGHSKWANIKHRKGRVDAKRSKQWSKCSRAIIVAARGGGDPHFNTTLRYAIEEAKAANMPKDTIEKAIKKGTGELEGETYEEARYEGYGPGGVAILADCLIANVNKAASEIRSVFTRAGGNLGAPGSVGYGFSKQGLILLDGTTEAEDAVMEVALEAGADDIKNDQGLLTVTTDASSFTQVRDALKAGGHAIEQSEVTFVPQTLVDVGVNGARKILRLIDALEDNDDVQKVYHNADIPAEAYE